MHAHLLHHLLIDDRIRAIETRRARPRIARRRRFR
jgi:hypothetical protein